MQLFIVMLMTVEMIWAGNLRQLYIHIYTHLATSGAHARSEEVHEIDDIHCTRLRRER